MCLCVCVHEWRAMLDTSHVLHTVQYVHLVLLNLIDSSGQTIWWNCFAYTLPNDSPAQFVTALCGVYSAAHRIHSPYILRYVGYRMDIHQRHTSSALYIKNLSLRCTDSIQPYTNKAPSCDRGPVCDRFASFSPFFAHTLSLSVVSHTAEAIQKACGFCIVRIQKITIFFSAQLSEWIVAYSVLLMSHRRIYATDCISFPFIIAPCILLRD